MYTVIALSICSKSNNIHWLVCVLVVILCELISSVALKSLIRVYYDTDYN